MGHRRLQSPSQQSLGSWATTAGSRVSWIFTADGSYGAEAESSDGSCAWKYLEELGSLSPRINLFIKNGKKLQSNICRNCDLCNSNSRCLHSHNLKNSLSPFFYFNSFSFSVFCCCCCCFYLSLWCILSLTASMYLYALWTLSLHNPFSSQKSML